MRYTYIIILVLFVVNWLKSQCILETDIVVLNQQTLYTLQNNPKQCPSIHKLSHSNLSNELLWISASDRFNGAIPIWDVYDGMIYTLSVMDYSNTALIGFHKTTWNSLMDNNNKFAESSNILNNVNNWPNDNFRMEVGSLPFRDIKNSLRIGNTLFADINIDARLIFAILDTSKTRLTIWELDIDPSKITTEGSHYFAPQNDGPKTRTNGGSWSKSIVIENTNEVSSNFRIFTTKDSREFLLIDESGKTFSIYSNGTIEKKDIRIKPSTIFVKDKDNKKTYFIDKIQFDQIVDSFKSEIRTDNSIINSIKSECYMEF